MTVGRRDGERRKRCTAAEGFHGWHHSSRRPEPLQYIHKEAGRFSKTAKEKSLKNSGFFSTGAVGIEPTSMVLETTVLPLNYAPTCGPYRTDELYYSIACRENASPFLRKFCRFVTVRPKAELLQKMRILQKKYYGKFHKYSRILNNCERAEQLIKQEKQQYPFPACNYKKGKV